MKLHGVFLCANIYIWQEFKNGGEVWKTQPVYHTSSLIDRSTLSMPTQSAAGPGDAIQISWILKNPSAETT